MLSSVALAKLSAAVEIFALYDFCIMWFLHYVMYGEWCPLQKLSRKYFETKFARINVETAKFLVTKLKVQVLPAIFCFKKGIVVDK